MKHISKLRKNYLTVILLATISVLSCSNNEGDNGTIPDDAVIAGDISTVDNYYEITDQELTLSNERIENGLRILTAQRQLDLNEDGIFNMTFDYSIRTNDSGFKNYFLTVSGANLYVFGLSQDVLGNPGLAPRMLSEGEAVRTTSENWPVLPLHTYLSFVEADNDFKLIDLNFFPAPESNGYLMFKFFTSPSTSVAGWVHLEQTSNNHQPRLLDVGYKVVN